MKTLTIAGLLAASMSFGTAAQAATITLDFTGISGGNNVALGGDFIADDLRIVSGNCAAASGAPCAAFNGNETTTITRSGGGSFTLTSFWYQLLGARAELEVSFLDSMGGILSSIDFDGPTDGNNDGGHVVSGSITTPIFGILFDNPGNNPGNVRVDDLVLAFDDAPAPVPIPAAGLMLLTALGGAAAMRRRAS